MCREPRPQGLQMTEAEWLACSDPTPMLAFLRGPADNSVLPCMYFYGGSLPAGPSERLSLRQILLLASGCTRRFELLVGDSGCTTLAKTFDEWADANWSIEQVDSEYIQILQQDFAGFSGSAALVADILGCPTDSLGAARQLNNISHCTAWEVARESAEQTWASGDEDDRIHLGVCRPARCEVARGACGRAGGASPNPS